MSDYVKTLEAQGETLRALRARLEAIDKVFGSGQASKGRELLQRACRELPLPDERHKERAEFWAK